MINSFKPYHLWQVLINAAFVFFGIIIFIPITIILLILNPFYNKGPLFYTQVRLGKNYKPFQLIKFRTMVVNSEVNGAEWAKENDSRATRLGIILRKFRIDELPQLINVILFQINLIGPRAERPELHDLILKEVPNFFLRLKIKPGITGHAQIVGGYSNDIEGAKTKLKHDLDYINKQSVLFDIKILIKTVNEVLVGAGL
jgi:lipopolysaccharide/colanic/teichoic acid biosynthesis glycosyltransferase